MLRRALFGGAMVAVLPGRMQDISEVRQVPDNQEVYADAAADQSFVFEILETVDGEGADCVTTVFNDLATSNEATSSRLENVSALEPEQYALSSEGVQGYSGSGRMQVAKAREGPEASNELQVHVAVLRVPQKQADIVVTLNTPTMINPASSSAEHTGSGPTSSAGGASDLFMGVVASLHVADWGLFGS